MNEITRISFIEKITSDHEIVEEGIHYMFERRDFQMREMLLEKPSERLGLDEGVRFQSGQEGSDGKKSRK